MKTSQSVCRALLLLVCLLTAGRAQATTFQTIESSYLGDGWFQYDVKVLYDPFFLQADLVQFAIIMTNGVNVESAITPPGNWKNDTNGGSWIYTGPAQTRPNEQVFLMHSSATNYMLGTNAISLVSLYTSEIYPSPTVVTANLVGYAIVRCLLPCPPGMADNSPTNHLETVVFVEDPVIKQLMVGPATYGLVFDWGSDSTDLLQASPDMINWTNVTYFYGTNGTTVWTTNQHFLDHGRYFRLQMVAGQHTTNVPPLTASAVRTPAIKSPPTVASTLRVTSCQPHGDVVSVEVATDPGQTGEVRMVNSHGVILQTQPFSATSNSVVVNFSAKNVTGPVLFQAVASMINTGL